MMMWWLSHILTIVVKRIIDELTLEIFHADCEFGFVPLGASLSVRVCGVCVCVLLRRVL